ncbi:MAG: hypothetical protein SOT08_05050 [Candidatus Borkfalkiaceae bacterium]|nr:hypothetical protein [Christensenellaceae bacterium]
MEEARMKYADIIDLPHHQSERRQKMSNYDRAAQFSPFAALTGHADSIKETARLTDDYNEPSEQMKAIMNKKILFLMEQLENQPEITITFFKPDEKKEGGAYITITGVVKKIKTYERQMQMTTGDLIPIDMIFGIDGEIFSKIDY